ncbi:HypC/HybG/HupF family hydrogenase formation chaperone [Actinomadura algeriensis]|uniref:Hydrogenase expression/formation protein HypC n=1 Tax=Actinomadura algeriensis TaxID=1679523 RepID=A0ABR9JNQ0_9ACTN|nr:HypC/HybG/HupF family hydrogenase formation chaperone [Actinomadura algeriensis]MBE1532182.1 hydrogenase expression/formation protein HypC [Actinomadura algeriensis]
MCLGIPGEIVELPRDGSDVAKVEVVGVRRAVNVGLLDEERLHLGDWVLVHVGFAMSKIDEAEAAATLELLRGLGEAYDDELDALSRSDLDLDLDKN